MCTANHAPVSSALRGPQPSTSSSQFLSLPLYKSLDLQRELIREFETTHDFKIISVKHIERISPAAIRTLGGRVNYTAPPLCHHRPNILY